MESRNKTLWALLLVAVMLSCGPPRGYSQTFAEFFKQKKTQKRYLLEQITALQVYTGYAKKGYELVGGGLGLVRDLSKGEFSLHSGFISSLKSVSPLIKNNLKVTEIISWQIGIVRAFSAVGPHALLSAADQLYIAEVKAGVLSDCAADLEELLMIVTSGRLEMREQERLLRLDQLYLAMQDKAAFTQSFCSQVAMLLSQREKEEEAIHHLYRQYGILE